MKYTEKLKFVMDGIKNGIELEDGSTREIDIIDYYEVINEKQFTFYNKVAHYLNSADRVLLSTYLSSTKYPRVDQFKFSEILEMEIGYGTTKLPNGKEVGEKKYLSREEKIGIYNYLEKHEIPVVGNTYYGAMKRYMRGQLEIEEAKKKIKVRKKSI